MDDGKMGDGLFLFLGGVTWRFETAVTSVTERHTGMGENWCFFSPFLFSALGNTRRIYWNLGDGDGKKEIGRFVLAVRGGQPLV